MPMWPPPTPSHYRSRCDCRPRSRCGCRPRSRCGRCPRLRCGCLLRPRCGCDPRLRSRWGRRRRSHGGCPSRSPRPSARTLRLPAGPAPRTAMSSAVSVLLRHAGRHWVPPRLPRSARCAHRLSGVPWDADRLLAAEERSTNTPDRPPAPCGCLLAQPPEWRCPPLLRSRCALLGSIGFLPACLDQRGAPTGSRACRGMLIDFWPLRSGIQIAPIDRPHHPAAACLPGPPNGDVHRCLGPAAALRAALGSFCRSEAGYKYPDRPPASPCSCLDAALGSFTAWKRDISIQVERPPHPAAAWPAALGSFCRLEAGYKYPGRPSAPTLQLPACPAPRTAVSTAVSVLLWHSGQHWVPFAARKRDINIQTDRPRPPRSCQDAALGSFAAWRRDINIQTDRPRPPCSCLIGSIGFLDHRPAPHRCPGLGPVRLPIGGCCRTPDFRCHPDCSVVPVCHWSWPRSAHASHGCRPARSCSRHGSGSSLRASARAPATALASRLCSRASHRHRFVALLTRQPPPSLGASARAPATALASCLYSRGGSLFRFAPLPAPDPAPACAAARAHYRSRLAPLPAPSPGLA